MIYESEYHYCKRRKKKSKIFLKIILRLHYFFLTQTALTHTSEEKKYVRSWSNVIAWLCVIRYKLAI